MAVINFDVKGGATVEKLVLHPAGLGLVYSKGTGPGGFPLELPLILTRGSQWGGGIYGYRLKSWLFYGYRLFFFSYG